MKPVARITLALVVAVLVLPAFAQEQLPKAETLLDKYIEVTGGRAAYLKVSSEVVTGTMEFGAMGMKGTMTAYHAAPALLLVEINLEGVGRIQEGTDGKVAWSLSAVQGPRVKDGDERAEALRAAAMYTDVNWREYYSKVETVGAETVEGKPCYKVALTPKEGSAFTRYYDKDTGLLVKMVRTVKSPMGEVAVESIPTDYQKDGDILSPHATTERVAGQEIRVRIDKVEHNVTIPREKFDLPDEIKALVAKGK